MKTTLPNILLIVMDATRVDHVSCYGYHSHTTPNLDTLAASGIIFENAFATSAWTPPSFASIFSGCYPSMHKVTGKNLVFGDNIASLPQVLSENGYHTACFSTTAWINATRGFDRGFDNFVETWRRSSRSPKYGLGALLALGKKFLYGRDKYTRHLNSSLRHWLSDVRRDDNPFFICAHYHNTHSPYRPPRAFKKKFALSDERNYDVRKLLHVSTKAGAYGYMAKKIAVSEAEFDVIKAWYDGELSYMDYHIGELVSSLKKMGYFENTVLIITADHGENFGEHGLAFHQFCLYDTLIHVPLIIVAPSLHKKAARIKTLVSLVDLFSTILDLAGIDTGPYEHIDGRSFASFEEDSHRDYILAEYQPPDTILNILRTRYPDFDYSLYQRSMRCVRTREYKFIRYSDGQEEFYDMIHDPLENNNLIGHGIGAEEDLGSILSDWEVRFNEDDVEVRTPEEDKEIRKKLELLGYL